MTMTEPELYKFGQDCSPEYGYGICLASDGIGVNREDNICLGLPFSTVEQAGDFLEHMDSSTYFAGPGLVRLGDEIPQLRNKYERLLNKFTREIEDKIANQRRLGLSKEDIAKWAVSERRRIATQIRNRQGSSMRVLFEIRDNFKYGLGGRTHRNMSRYYARQGVSSHVLDDRIIRGARNANRSVSSRAMSSARYLKHGGKIVLVFAISATVYTYLTASEDELERLIYEDVGGLIGGGLGVGACLLFGIATGGWGLLACGVIGGIGGSMAGEQIYYSQREPLPIPEADEILQFDVGEFYAEFPMCY